MIRGKIRLFVQSLVFASRSRRRGLIFMVVYAALASGVFLSMAHLEHNYSVLLRESAALWLDEKGPQAAKSEQTAVLTAFLNEQKLPVARIVPIEYTLLAAGKTLFRVDPKKPWAAAHLNPKLIQEGRFLKSLQGEALVSNNFSLPTPTFPNSEIQPRVGSVLKLQDRTLTITGVISVPHDLPPESQLLVVGPEAFKALAKYKDTFLKEFIVIAKGSSIFPGLFGNTLTNADQIHSGLLKQTALWEPCGLTKPTLGGEVSQRRDRDLMPLPLVGFGILGSLIALLFYGYLASRYRLREAAVLKALGFYATEVSIYLLAEVLLIAVGGLLISFVGVRIHFSLAVEYAAFQLNDMYSLFTALVLLCVNISGFILTNRRARRVEPMTLFRDI